MNREAEFWKIINDKYKEQNKTMAKEVSKTQYLKVPGKVKWAKIYTPDEYRGAVRWSVQFYPTDDGWDMIKKAGIQKKIKDKGEGKFIDLYRPTTKMIKGRIVHFTPPILYDKSGKTLVEYQDNNGKTLRSYDDENTDVTRIGDPVLIGNDSDVLIHLSVYPTAMGPGNRLDAITIVDLIHYEKPEEKEENKETKGEEVEQEKNATPPW